MLKIIITILLLFNSQLYAQSINPNSANNTAQKNTDLQSLGITIGKKLQLIEGIASFDKSEDSIFVEPHIFYDKFKNDSELDFSYGGGFNVGYNYKKIDVFAGVGFLRSGFDYELNNQVSELEKNSFFYSVGTRYNLYKYVGFYLESKFYEIEFKDSASSNFEADNISFTFGISLNL